MSRLFGVYRVGLFALLFVCSISSFAQLSPNSGINPNDTYVVFDVSIQGSGTTTLAQAIYNPSTNTTSNVVSLNAASRAFHIEMGYDVNDQIVMNLVPMNGGGDPTLSGSLGVSKVQLVNGKLTIFDETGAPLPIVAPDNAPLVQPLASLGPIPGSSLLKALVITNPTSTASDLHASVQYSNEITTHSYRIAAMTYLTGTSVPMAYISMPASTGGDGTLTLAYQQVGSTWVLVRNSLNTTQMSTQMSNVAEFSNIVWLDNLIGDSRRAAKATIPPPAPGFADPGYSTPVLPAADTTNANLEIQHPAAGPTNILLQHGLNSNARTWDRMDPWLQQDFGLNYVVKPNLRWSDPLTTQANSLINVLAPTGLKNSLGVGYSQGGLITRDVAYRRFDLINNVITLDTPNNGANITRVDRAALAGAMTYLTKVLVAWGNGTPLTGAISKLGNILFLNVPASTVMAFDAAVPATTDLTPGSYYLNTLNNRTEGFRRVGIEGASRWRFVEWRLAGDRSCNPEDACGGRATYVYANAAYYSLLSCQFVAWFFGYYDWAYACGTSAFVMDYIDLFWYTYTSFGDSSDGIVQSAGQFYNRASFNHNISDADSHSAVSKSDKVRKVLEASMQNEFNILPKWCMSGAASPASFSVTDLGGGSQSFTVTTGSPCPWTAVSSVPWITIKSGGSGKTSGTVVFSVDINLSPVSRTGTITMTGLGTTPSVTVTQAGIPAGASIGGVIISGREQSFSQEECPENYAATETTASLVASSSRDVVPMRPVCPIVTTWDNGTVSVTVNGYTIIGYYGARSTAASVASGFAASINADPNSPVRAGVISTTVYIVSKATSNANYPYSAGYTWDEGYFSTPSFTTTTLGPIMTGSPQQ